MEEKVICPTCQGSGEVHSHNPKCPDCRGLCFVTQEKRDQILAEQRKNREIFGVSHNYHWC